MNLPEPKPLHCRPCAFEALAEELEALDTTRGLLRCAVAVSMHQLDDADADEVEGQIDALAGSVTDRVHGGNPRALLAHAHAVLFEEARFTGNKADYYSPFNSYLPRILKTRKGLPISLALLYKCVLETVGLRVRGINAPGHFLAGVCDAPTPAPGKTAGSGRDDQTPGGGVESSGGGGWLLIDPFHGGTVLSREEAFTRIEEIAGGSVVRDDALLRPATHAEWLTRLIQNLVTAFDRIDRPDDVAAMLEMRSLVESVR